MQSVTDAFNEIAAGKDELKDLKIVNVKELISNGVKIMIVIVPYKQIRAFQTSQTQFLPELEKKLGAQVYIVGQIRAFPIEPEHKRRYKAIRPVSRTLKNVNQKILENLVYPATIVGKSVHYSTDGKQLTKVFLDKSIESQFADRLTGFAAAYDRLTGIKSVFEFAEN